VSIDLPALLGRLSHRYPSFLVDAVAEHEPGTRLVAVKNLTVNEEFFQGHFPGAPLMPAVLTIEALTQAAAALLLERDDVSATARVALRGIDGAKFRRQVIPGDQVRLEVRIERVRSSLGKAHAKALVAGQIVAEATLLLSIDACADFVDSTAVVHPSARIGAGTVVEANAVIGPQVTIGRRCRIGAAAVVGGWTDIGDDTQVYPMASIGMAPQHLRFKSEGTQLTIGRGNTFREFVTINRATVEGGGQTRIGERNFFMAYVHVAHDCQIGSDTIFGPHATLGGHVIVEDFANVSAGTAVHQFCRVGRHAFTGGYSVVTKDALPFGRTIGSRPARIFGVNTIGLARRGFTPDTIAQLKRAYRYLLQSKLNTSRAVAAIRRDSTLTDPEVAYLLNFIWTSKRGVILRKPSRPAEEAFGDE
jgi:UDP-N-acetylglucosamine acyltransferase